MTRDLATADKIVKTSMAGGSLALYCTGAIAGPWANVLALIATVVLVVHTCKMFFHCAKRNHV